MARWPVEGDSRGGTSKALVRLGIAAGVGLVLLATFAIWWDAPRVEAPDLEPVPLPPLTDAENGLVPFENFNVTEHPRFSEALELIRVPRHVDDAPPPEWDHELANAVLAHHANLLAAVDEALARPGFRFPEPKLDAGIESLEALRTAAHLKRLEAWSRFHSGDHEGAVRSAIKLATLGRRITEGECTMFFWIVGTGTAATGLDAMLRIAEHTDERAAVAAMLDSRSLWHPSRERSLSSLSRTLGFEFLIEKEHIRLKGRDAINELWIHRHSPSWHTLLVKPNMTLALCRDLIRETLANAKRLPADWTFPLADELTADQRSPFHAMDFNYRGRMTVGETAGVHRMVLRTAVHLETMQTFANLAPALRLHEMDHGALPETLDALVPAYLDALPADPFNGEPLRYDAARRLVWSVGDDFIDAGGQTEFLRSGTEWRKEPTLIVPEP